MMVLHVHSGNVIGGVERVLVSLAGVDRLKSGLEHEFALVFESSLGLDLEERGARVHSIGEVRTRKPWTIMRARRRLRSLIRDRQPDVVLTHSAWAQAILAPAVPRARAPQVYWAHDVLDGRGWIQRWAKRTRPDLVICSSRFICSGVRNLYPQVRTRVVYCPLDHVPDTTPGTREAVRGEIGTGADDVVIVQVSRLDPFKGLAELIEALGTLKDDRRWSFWQVGGAQTAREEQFLASLRRRVDELGLQDRVQFLGQRRDVARIFAAADIYCQPNRSPEPFGLTLVEALHAGLPVVANDFGGASEVLDGYGYLVKPNDIRELATTLRGLIESPVADPAVARRRMGRAWELTNPVTQTRYLRDALETVIETK